ncbi:MAG TPA: hypothetical protein VLJ21_03345 [Candidatus Binatia bacterium]|nr:hypothetical protein [Candidatus Binatia bacterium]
MKWWYFSPVLLVLAGCMTSPQTVYAKEGCDLMRNAGEEQCFGCANGICTEPPDGYVLIEANSGWCATGDQGCYLKTR